MIEEITLVGLLREQLVNTYSLMEEEKDSDWLHEIDAVVRIYFQVRREKGSRNEQKEEEQSYLFRRRK